MNVNLNLNREITIEIVKFFFVNLTNSNDELIKKKKENKKKMEEGLEEVEIKNDELLYSTNYVNMDETKYIYCHTLFNNTQSKFKTWPKKTNISCYNCTHPFATTPVSIPHNYDFVTKKWELSGIYCSLACAKRAILEDNYHNVSTMITWLRLFARDVLRYKNLQTIQAAPPRYILKKFGGPYDIKTFRKRGTKGKRGVIKMSGNFVSWPMIMKSSKPFDIDKESGFEQRIVETNFPFPLFKNKNQKKNVIEEKKEKKNHLKKKSLYEKYIQKKTKVDEPQPKKKKLTLSSNDDTNQNDTLEMYLS